jgi:hypothetical protein
MKYTLYAVGIAAFCLPLYPMEKTQTTEPKTTFARDIVDGAAAGSVEVLVNNPLIVWTNRLILTASDKRSLQEKLTALVRLISSEEFKNSFRSRELLRRLAPYYKGCGTGIASMAPITAFQNSVALALNKLFKDMPEKIRLVLAAGMAGYLSAIMSSPGDLVVLQRQHPDFKGESFKDTLQRIYETRGARNFYRGATGTGVRDGLFTIAYKSGGDLLLPYMPKTGNTRFDSTLANALIAILAAYVSHPAHVISARMKSDLAKTKYRSTLQTAFKLLSQEGAEVFLKGVTPRASRILLAVPLLNYLTKEHIGTKAVDTIAATVKMREQA